MKYTVEIACDTPEADAFESYLVNHGHRAYIGTSTGTFVKSARTDDGYDADDQLSDESEDEIISGLWADYCNEV